MRSRRLVVLLGMLAACGALLGLPIYFFVKDKQRRGDKISFPGLIDAVLIGVLGVVAVWLFLFTNGESCLRTRSPSACWRM